MLALYRRVAGESEGLARGPSEISLAHIQGILQRCSRLGLILVLEDRDTHTIEGMIHAEGNEIASLSHVMGHLTVLIDPRRQKQGLGKKLFQEFLRVVQEEFPHIVRVELRARASNQSALGLYESLGFEREGLFRSRIRDAHGRLEDGVPMVWFRQELPTSQHRVGPPRHG
jgi:ribosomal protein S18 acetylase RimI-like enzyme